jgi:LacI family transcriptional regulator
VSIPPDTEPHALVDRATDFGRRVDGLILTNVITVDQLRQIEQAGVPAVLYGYPMGSASDGNDVPPVPIVTSDWVSMGRRATQAMIDIGHRRIGFISGEFIPNMWHERCYDGYTAALIHADLPIDKSIVFAAKAGDSRAGTSAAPVFLAMKESRPTAYLAVNPGTAGRFVEAMREGGVSIGPREMVVCGYPHRMEEFALDDYPLVYMDPAKIVSAAVMQLRAKCLHQSGGNYTVLVPYSTRNLPKKAE